MQRLLTAAPDRASYSASRSWLCAPCSPTWLFFLALARLSCGCCSGRRLIVRLRLPSKFLVALTVPRNLALDYVPYLFLAFSGCPCRPPGAEAGRRMGRLDRRGL